MISVVISHKASIVFHCIYRFAMLIFPKLLLGRHVYMAKIEQLEKRLEAVNAKIQKLSEQLKDARETKTALTTEIKAAKLAAKEASKKPAPVAAKAEPSAKAAPKAKAKSAKKKK